MLPPPAAAALPPPWRGPARGRLAARGRAGARGAALCLPRPRPGPTRAPPGAARAAAGLGPRGGVHFRGVEAVSREL